MIKNKPIIFCFVGESASGKSRCAEYIRNVFNIDIIKSYTTRAKRLDEVVKEAEGGILDHTYVTEAQFDKINEADKIAFTRFGKARYCCTKQDVLPINIYIIDEPGLNLLKHNHSEDYDIVSFRFICNKAELIRRTNGDIERIERNADKFTTPLYDFDYRVHTDIADINVVRCTMFNNIVTELRKRGIYGNYDWNVKY